MPITITDTAIDGINSARDFWTEIAQPDYQEYQSEPLSLRRAFHAATSLFHVADWVVKDHKHVPKKIFGVTTLTNFRSHIVQNECPDFKLIRDVANASKHFRLDWGQPIVRSATEVTVRSTGWGEGRDGEGTFGGTPQVVIDPSTGARHFSAVAKNVYEMWDRLFQQERW